VLELARGGYFGASFTSDGPGGLASLGTGYVLILGIQAVAAVSASLAVAA